MVKGLDAEESKTTPLGQQQTPDNSPAPSVVSDEEKSGAGEGGTDDGGSGTTKKRKASETMQAMLRRISDFIKV